MQGDSHSAHFEFRCGDATNEHIEVQGNAAWRRDTTAMARDFISLGFRAVICCVDSEALDGKFEGRDFDAQFVTELPLTVDACGEFHSFVYNGPIVKRGSSLKSER